MAKSIKGKTSRDQREVGVRRLRADLASHVQRAGRGDSMVVTVNGRPTARLGPLPCADAAGRGQSESATVDSLDALADAGMLRRPIDSGRRMARPEPIVIRYPADVDPDRVVTEVLAR